MRENQNKRLRDFVAGATQELVVNLSGLTATDAIRVVRAILDELTRVHTMLVDAETERAMRRARKTSGTERQ